MRLLKSPDQARPFVDAVPGMWPSEGAAVAVLESRRARDARGATARAKLLAHGEGFEPTLTSRAPVVDGIAAALRLALARQPAPTWCWPAPTARRSTRSSAPRWRRRASATCGSSRRRAVSATRSAPAARWRRRWRRISTRERVLVSADLPRRQRRGAAARQPPPDVAAGFSPPPLDRRRRAERPRAARWRWRAKARRYTDPSKRSRRASPGARVRRPAVRRCRRAAGRRRG